MVGVIIHRHDSRLLPVEATALRTLLASIVLAANLLAVPCSGAEPENLSLQPPSVTTLEHPESLTPPEKSDEPSIQPCDAMPGFEDMD